MKRGDLYINKHGEILEIIKDSAEPLCIHVRARYGRNRFLRSVQRADLTPYVRGSKKAATTKYDTCQICGRACGTKAGVIAHHGYRRPGNGWQTASCFGARHRPYEIASDALPPYLESLDALSFTKREFVATLHAGIAPARRPTSKKTIYNTGEVKVYVETNAHNQYGARDYALMTPGNEYAQPGEADHQACAARLIKSVSAEIKAIADERERAAKRLADWKAPQ